MDKALVLLIVAALAINDAQARYTGHMNMVSGEVKINSGSVYVIAKGGAPVTNYCDTQDSNVYGFADCLCDCKNRGFDLYYYSDISPKLCSCGYDGWF